MDYHVRLHLTTAAIVIALGFGVSLVTSTVVAARAYQARGEQVTRRAQTITVKGSTRQRIRSDRAVWAIAVRGEGKSLPDAFAVLDAGIHRVRAFLGQNGFSDPEIGLAAIETTVRHVRDQDRRETHEIAGYALERTFTVATGDVERVHRSAGRVTELIQDGVFVISQAPEYYYTKLGQLRIELMAAASADARARAARIAESTGCQLGPLREAQMGVLQVTPPDSTEVRDYGLYDTSTVDKDVQAVVTATFAIRAE